MKKSLVAALAGMFVVGAAGTTFAAANPFSDVPAGHWAYDSVTRLANEGVIEGYGDGTYRGNRNITRYEMAQMVARALARAPRTTISSSSRADLDKLAAEFRDELDSLGVRVAELERNADKVKWAGKIEYTYNHRKFSGEGSHKLSGHGGVFRLEPNAEINDHWKAVARFDAGYDGQADSTNYAKLKRVYAEGDYDKFGVKLGRFGYCPSIEDGIVADTVLSGLELKYGSKWQGIVSVGRIGKDSDEAHAVNNSGYNKYANAAGVADASVNNDSTDVISLNIRYNPGDSGLYGGASYYYAKDKDFGVFNKNGKDKSQIWAVGLGYKFSDMFDLHGSFAQNTKANDQKNAWAVDLRYGRYGDYAEKGDWAIWAGYAKFGMGAVVASDQGDDIATGEKGWHVGAAYAPFKNVGILLRYADAKVINTNIKDKHFWARGEFFF